MNIFYIAGYGRSGSTLLDRTLGAKPGVVSCGEIAYITKTFTSNGHMCSCGSTVAECELWSGIFNKKLSPSRDTSVFMNNLGERLGDGASIVDSSKSAYGQMLRPFTLKRLGHSIFPVLIWRDPKEVIRSRSAAQQRSGRTPESSEVSWMQALSGSIGWTVANVAGLLAVYKLNGQVVRFEYFRDHQVEVSNSLVDHSKFHLSPTRVAGDHVAVGNRMRNSDPTEARSKSVRPTLKRPVSVAITVICWPMLLLLRHYTGKQY